MQAEIISIGDELTSGQRLDTNSQWLSQQLGELGIETIRHTTVGDHLSGNIDAFRRATQRAEIVVCSGGLGPTLDDLTRQAMAEAFHRPLQLDEPSLRHIEQLFSHRGREMPHRNRQQAMFPQGSQIIPNPHGSAPGIDLWLNTQAVRSRVFALPGVPAELKQMWRESVVPRIEAMQGSAAAPLRHHSLKVFGIGESDVEVKLPDLIRRDRSPTVGITVSRATITLRIAARASSEQEFAAVVQPTVHEIQTALGDLIFGEGEDELEHAVLRHLRLRELSLASLEIGAASCLGDWLLRAEADSPVEQAPRCYSGGIALPSVADAWRWLAADNLGPQPPSATGPQPLAMWEALAQQTRRRFQADIGLALGIYPSQGQMESATDPFDCFFALAFPDQTSSYARRMGGHPDVLGSRIAKTGLDLLRQHLTRNFH